MQMRFVILALLVQLLPAWAINDPAKSAAPYHDEFPLFRSANMASTDKLPTGIGFHSFRILAFAEGRRHTNQDFGDINLVHKRSKTTSNNGAAPSDWESLREVVGSGAGTWGNPTPVVDDGNTWSKPVDLTKELTPNGWAWDAGEPHVERAAGRSRRRRTGSCTATTGPAPRGTGLWRVGRVGGRCV